MVVGRLLSYWEGHFSGAMLNFRGVTVRISNDLGEGYIPGESLMFSWGFVMSTFTVSQHLNEIGSLPFLAHISTKKI